MRRPGRPQPDPAQPEPLDTAVLDALQARDGRPTTVVLADGRTLPVVDVAWGYDTGEAYAHVTTNISPGAPGRPVDVFRTQDVVRVLDEHGDVVLERP